MELYDPCNVLLPTTDVGDYGFGHLKFQEYLVAKELVTKNIESIAGYLSEPWWKGAFTLVAQMPEDIDRYIDWFGDNIGILGARDTLEAMVEARLGPEKELLKQRLDYFLNVEKEAFSEFIEDLE